MKTYFVVAGVVSNNGKILILKKSSDDRNYPNKWSFCSGFIKEFESAEDTVLREIKEETGLDAEIVKKGKIFQKDDKANGKSWIITPFLCNASSDIVNLDHENVEFMWIDSKNIKNYSTVPAAEKDLKILGLIK